MRQTLVALVLLVHSLSILNSAVSGEALSTIFDGYYHGEAQVFEIRTKDGPVSVSSFDINLDLENDDERIEIWAKPGRQVGRPIDDGSFKLIQAFEGVVGQGKNNATSLPSFAVPIYIPPSTSYTFLVSATSDKYDLWYTRGSEVGRVYVEDENLQILEGWAISRQYTPWSYTEPRVFNGIVRYSIHAEPSSLPSVQPSLVPSYPPTVKEPLKTSQQPSTYPSLQPVVKFVSHPTTSHPTNAPTATKNRDPTSKPSSNPTLEIVASSTGAPFVSVYPDERRITHKPTTESETDDSDSAGQALRTARLCMIVGSTLLFVLIR